MNCYYCKQNIDVMSLWSYSKNTVFCEKCKAYQSYHQGYLYNICFMFDENKSVSDQSTKKGYWIVINVVRNQFSLELNNSIIIKDLPEADKITPANVQETLYRLLRLKAYL